MIKRWGIWLGLAALASTPGVGARDALGIQVEIGGEPGTRFTASWTLAPASPAERMGAVRQGEWQGEVPQAHRLPAGALTLELTQISEVGRLEVTVESGGNRSRSSTQGKGSTMRLYVQ